MLFRIKPLVSSRARLLAVAAIVSCSLASAGLPSPWASQDVYDLTPPDPPSVAGSSSESSGTFTLSSRGETLYNNDDDIHIVYQPISGDVEIEAHLVTHDLGFEWAKAAVTIRDTLDSFSRHATSTLGQGHGAYYFFRTTSAGATDASTSAPGNAYDTDFYLRLRRVGNQFTATASLDRVTWIQTGQTNVTMADPVNVGMLVASYDADTTGTAEFDTVTIYLPPQSFDLGLPSDTASAIGSDQEFTWSTSTNAKEYNLQIATDTGFINKVVDVTGIDETNYTISAGDLNPSTVYYWRVIASAGTLPGLGPDSTRFSFTTDGPPGAFSLTAPINGDPAASLEPTLTWGASSNATGYTVQVADDLGYTVPLDVDVTLGAVTSYAIPASTLAASTTYYWKVTASYKGFTTDASNINTTFVTGDPPMDFSQTDPADLTSDILLTHMLQWGDPGDATSYELTIADNVGYTLPAVDALSVATNSHTLAGTELSTNTQYYWKVTAVNTWGRTDALNAGISFTTINAPGSFSLVTPADATWDVSVTPTLQWGDAAAAQTYHVEVATDTGFTSTVVDDATLDTSEHPVPASTLANGTTYYWRVSATNTGGTTQAGNNYFTFTTTTGVVPVAFSLTSPASGATEVSVAPALAWDEATGFATYRVEVDDDADFSSALVDDATLTDEGYTVPAATLSAATVYYWRVTATNSIGDTTASNNGISFTTAPDAPPGTFALVAPDGTTGVITDLVVDWGDATNLPTYTLTVYDDIGLTNAVLTVDSLTQSTYTIPAGTLASNTTYYWSVTATNSQGSTPATGTGLTFETGTFAVTFLGDGCASKGSGTAAFWLVAWSLVWGMLEIRRRRGVAGT